MIDILYIFYIITLLELDKTNENSSKLSPLKDKLKVATNNEKGAHKTKVYLYWDCLLNLIVKNRYLLNFL